MTSKRLPGKAMKPILGRPSLDLMLERVMRVGSLSEIVLATTTNSADDPIVDLACQRGISSFRGSEEDVLGRVAATVRRFGAGVVVFLTGDCIAIDPAAIQKCIDNFRQGGADYVANHLVRTYPVGMDTHVFSSGLLEESEKNARSCEEREHLGLYIYRRPDQYRLRNVTAGPEESWPSLHLTLDTPEDFSLLEALYGGIYPSNPHFTVAEAISYLRVRPQLVALNSRAPRNKSASEYFSDISGPSRL